MHHRSFARYALLSLVLASCGGGQNANTESAANAASSSGAEQRRTSVVAEDDVSEVAAPAELIAVIRATSVRAIANRVARLGFVTEEQASGVGAELLSDFLHNEALARIVHLDRPMDGAVVFSGGRPSFVISLAVPAPQESLRRLGNRFRSRPLGNGVLELTDAQAERRQQQQDGEEESEPTSDENVCFLSPTPRATEGRLTCTSGGRAALEVVTPFLARTLTRRETRQDAIVATVFTSAVRGTLAQDVTRAFDEIEREFDRDLHRGSSPLHPEVRQSISRFAHEFMSNVRAFWSESVGLDLTLSLDDQRVRLVGSVDLRGPTGSFSRALIDGSRSAPALPDQGLQRLSAPSVVVLSGSLSRQAFAPFAQPLNEVAVALARHEARLPPATVTQLQEILSRQLDNDLSIAAIGSIDVRGRTDSVAVARCADAGRATTIVSDARALVTILRNRAMTRAIDNALQRLNGRPMNINWGQVRELPARGLPTGAFAFELPDFNELAQRARREPPPTQGRRPARPQPIPPVQYLLVPEGAHVTVVSGPDVRARWADLSARTGPALDLAAHGARQGAITMAIVPAGLADALQREAPQRAAAVRAVVSRMPDRGATPAILRLSNGEVEGNQRFSLEVEVQTSTLSGIAQGLR